jgi:hypothetical protein
VAWNIVYAGTAPAAGDPFTWHTAFDKEWFEPHNGSGSWGVQSTVKEPVAPTITSTGTASTATQLRDALYTGGVEVTLTADISSLSAFGSPVVDSTIIVPDGANLISPVIGTTGGVNTVTRLLIRSSTLGTKGTGRVHQLHMPTSGNDFVISGLDVTGTSNFFCLAPGSAEGFNRGAVVNCRLMAGGFGIGSTVGNLVVAGCSILTGNDLSFTEDEAYGIRAYFETNGNVIVTLCEIRSNPNRTGSSHARFRCHPDSGIEYVALLRNRLVERVENHIANDVASDGGGSGTALAFFFDDNEVISGGSGTVPSAESCDTPRLFGSDATHVFIRRNRFRSDGAFTSDANIAMSGVSSTTKEDNTYEGIPGTDPDYGTALSGTGATPGCGDPSGLDWTP